MSQSFITTPERTSEEIRNHYEIEKKLAKILSEAPKTDRRTLYTALYDELYRRVPDHPQLLQKASTQATQAAVARQLLYLTPWLTPETTFLEVGPGDCTLSFAVSQRVKQVYGVDVSNEITRAQQTPANFQLIVSDGCTIPLPPGCVNLAYSNQLMEHLHPDDAFTQLRDIYKALAPGGVYICVTPNRLTGPHDVSREFDEYATGFHLKEYTINELSRLFKEAGFSRVKLYIPNGSRPICLSTPPFSVGEQILASIPFLIRKRVARNRVVTKFLNIRLLAQK